MSRDPPWSEIIDHLRNVIEAGVDSQRRGTGIAWPDIRARMPAGGHSRPQRRGIRSRPASRQWEIAVKVSLGRKGFDVDPGAIARAAIETGFTELPIRASAAARVVGLAMFHKDPFDCLLVAQAIDEPAIFCTADPQLEPYSELVEMV